MSFVDKIFTYGTLRTSGPFFKMYSKYVLNIKSGYIYGTLYEDRGFPMLFLDNNGKVFGEIITLFNVKRVFSILDPQYKNKKRELVDVYLNDSEETFKSWTYVDIVDKNRQYGNIIEGGIWDFSKLDY